MKDRKGMESISTEEMRRVENKAHEMGMLKVFMMENAGNGIASHILSKFKSLRRKRIVVVAGTGNNGGDAFVAARHLAPYSDITVMLLGGKDEIKTEEAIINWRILEKMNRSIKLLEVREINDEIRRKIVNAHIVIDGIFGIGIKGRIREPHSSAIDAINASKGYIVAVDIPSGLDPDSGNVHDKCVKADATITFHKAKNGLRRKFCGKIIVCKIGIPPEAEV